MVPHSEGILYLQTSRRVRSGVELLPDGEAPLPDGRVRAPLRGGAGVLGPGHQPGNQLWPGLN